MESKKRQERWKADENLHAERRQIKKLKIRGEGKVEAIEIERYKLSSVSGRKTGDEASEDELTASSCPLSQHSWATKERIYTRGSQDFFHNKEPRGHSARKLHLRKYWQDQPPTPRYTNTHSRKWKAELIHDLTLSKCSEGTPCWEPNSCSFLSVFEVTQDHFFIWTVYSHTSVQAVVIWRDVATM